MVAMHIDARLRALNEAIKATATALSVADPLPTIERVVEILREQGRRLELVAMEASSPLYPPPPDPDAMSVPARFRLFAQMWAASYAIFMDEGALARLLCVVYGRQAVEVLDGQEEHGMLRVYPPRKEMLEARAMASPCASCGAVVTLEAGSLEAVCRHCRATARRVTNDGAAERELSELSELTDSPKERLPSLPPEGEGGLEVSDDNQMDLILDGLERLAVIYGSWISPARLAHVVASTFAHATADEIDRVLDVIAERVGASRNAHACDAIERARAVLHGGQSP